MGATAFVGRCMFAFVFLASAVNKLQTLSDPIAGAATLASIAPRLAAARALFAAKIDSPSTSSSRSRTDSCCSSGR